MEHTDDDSNPRIDAGSDQVQKCDMCNENFSDGYCSECEAYMCQTCFDRHLKIKPCRYHVLAEGSEHQLVDRKAQAEPCKIHENQIIEFFCVDHKNVGCAKCMLSDHSTCKREDIDVAAKRFHDNGDDARLPEKMQTIETFYTDCMQRVQQLTQNVTAAYDKTVNDIEEFKVSISMSIDETVRVALEKAEQWHRENENKIEKLSVALKEVRNSMGLCQESLESVKEMEKLFIFAIDIEPKLADYQERLSALKTENITSEYKFQANKIILDMIRDSRMLGEVLLETEKRDVGNLKDNGGRGALQNSSPSSNAQSVVSSDQEKQTETQHNSHKKSDGCGPVENSPAVPQISCTGRLERTDMDNIFELHVPGCTQEKAEQTLCDDLDNAEQFVLESGGKGVEPNKTKKKNAKRGNTRPPIRDYLYRASNRPDLEEDNDRDDSNDFVSDFCRGNGRGGWFTSRRSGRRGFMGLVREDQAHAMMEDFFKGISESIAKKK